MNFGPKSLKFFVFLLFAFDSGHALTRIINQEYFFHSRPSRHWASSDEIIILGAQKASPDLIARAHRNFSKFQKIYWLLSDDQWFYNRMNKDWKVLQFTQALRKTNIHVVPPNLCPEPFIIQKDKYDVIVIDSSWFLFPHRAEVYKQKCSSIEVEQFYAKIEQAILNAKLKPLIVVSHHGVHPRLLFLESSNSLVRWAQMIHQSLGPLDSISNPAYQVYQKKMNKMLGSRPNVLFVSANTTRFFQDSVDRLHHVALPLDSPSYLHLEPKGDQVKVSAKEQTDPIVLSFNELSQNVTSSCSIHDGPMYRFKLRNQFFRLFLGTNYRDLWNMPLNVRCLDFESAGLNVTRVSGSLRSPQFDVLDGTGNAYLVRPLKKEIKVPNALEDTLIEHMLEDQQSAINPVGYILAAKISEMMGFPSESPKLVYVDANQKAFGVWNDVQIQSGFYQMLHKPENLKKNPEWVARGLLDVTSTRDMFALLESKPGYHVDEKAYLLARMVDILVGDWDRDLENWYWMLFQRGESKVFIPFPISRGSAFYHANGVVSWWRRRKWINYKLQDYAKRLHKAQPMLVESLSMDYRFLSMLSENDWKNVLYELTSTLSPRSISQAIDSLPFDLPKRDRRLLELSFKKRLTYLPEIAQQMRRFLIKEPDVVATAGNDKIFVQSGPGPKVQVSLVRPNGTLTTQSFFSRQTKEIRLYGLGGSDEYHLDWKNYVPMKVRLVPGEGSDKVIAEQQKIKPRVGIYDDDVKIQSYYGFFIKDYDPVYNEFYSKVNLRKLDQVTPVVFLASRNPDTGYMVGGGIKYFQEGFQKMPWASTNEFKANFLFNRAAANLFYEGVWFDVINSGDFIVQADAGLPRFYGNFFGLGNDPDFFDPSQDQEFYWLRGRHFETQVKMDLPIMQYVSFIPEIEFRFRDFLFADPSILTTPDQNEFDTLLRPNTNADIQNPNFYLDAGATLRYLSADSVSGPVKRRMIRAEASWKFHQGLAEEDGRFHSTNARLAFTGYFQRSKTQWKILGGGGINFGDWEFFDAQFLGQEQNLRGYFTNRFAGDARVYDSLEINQSLLFKSWAWITDFGVGVFFDQGRVFFDGDIGAEAWHEALGGQGWITFLNAVAFRFGYARPLADERGIWNFTLTTEL